MARLPILVAPHPILKQPAHPVETVTDDVRQLVDDMFETMYDDKGIGLAAPQVGVSQRVLITDTAQAEDSNNPLVFINPEIIWKSEERNVYNEGCLSLPQMYAEVERPKIVRVKYLDYDGKEQEQEVDGLLATCLQHEIDHLDGILFVDHVSKLKKGMVMRKLKKLSRDGVFSDEARYIL